MRKPSRASRSKYMRLEQSKRDRARHEAGARLDEIAMVGADVDEKGWQDLPEYHRQLWRMRARVALDSLGL